MVSCTGTYFYNLLENMLFCWWHGLCWLGLLTVIVHFKKLQKEVKEMELFKRLIVEEEGQGLTEYALILGLVVLGIWIAVSATDLGNNITGLFTDVAGEVSNCC